MEVRGSVYPGKHEKPFTQHNPAGQVMLRSLSIRNILLVEALELDFQSGLNVLTGETGAGKSILLDCLGFVLGWRGPADLLRQGAQSGEVVVEFELSAGHPAHALLERAGLGASGELVVRRTIALGGRKRGFINDRRVSADLVRELSGILVELHGQRDDRGLLNSAGHRDLLDAFGGHGGKLSATRAAWRKASGAKDAYRAAEQAQEKASRDADYLRHAVSELDALNPKSGEDQDLDARRRFMQASGRVRAGIKRAAEALGASGAEGLMADAARWLEDASSAVEGRLAGAQDALSRAVEELAETSRGVDLCLAALDFDPLELEKAEERLFAIRDLARKHKVAPDALAELAGEFRAKLEKIETGAAQLGDLEKAVTEADEHFKSCASALSGARAAAGRRLDVAMKKELPPLKLERVKFETGFEPLTEAGANGAESIAFWVATNPGMPAGPIEKVASGGELSRLLLALKVSLAKRADGLTMVFDEIDRGVGGATADAVGRRLSTLAELGQVLVVTHSPQVAARARHHWRVEKSVRGGKTRTEVVALDAPARIDEVARMLAGDVVTDAAKTAAEALLEG